MSTAPPLILTQEQATRLLAYIQTYRRYILTQLALSAERNQNQRLLQMSQGKLTSEMDQQEKIIRLFLTSDEMKVMKMMVANLLVLTANDPTSEKRSATLVDLVELKATLERLYRQGEYARIPF